MNEDETTNIPETIVETETTTTEQSLDDFEAEFFSGKAPVTEPVVENEEVEGELSEEPEESNDEPELPLEEEDGEEEETEEESEAPKKESRAQKRIRELNDKYREAERRAEELERKLREKDTETPKEQPKPETNSNEENRAPHWDDLDDNGDPKYPLGQFDPKFNSDLVRHTIQEEQRRFQEEQQQREAQRRQQEADAALQQEWEEKLAPARERYPDFMERGQELVDQFQDLDPNYGKYLTDTIRAIDNGPDVLYYLASNPDLAREIVSKGPALASVALGRISAQFGEPEQPKTTTRTKVTKASPPPPTVRGSAQPKTKNILENLDDFEQEFFSR